MVTHPDDHPNPTLVSAEWAKKKVERVPTWFTELHEEVSAGQPTQNDVFRAGWMPGDHNFPMACKPRGLVMDEGEPEEPHQFEETLTAEGPGQDQRSTVSSADRATCKAPTRY